MSSIVLIDEDILMRALLTEWLTAAGYAVRARALRQAPTAEAADLVIVDLYMPREAGADVVRTVQQAHPGAPVIAISAQFRAGLRRSGCAARALGVSRVIAKPFAREELLSVVRELIG